MREFEEKRPNWKDYEEIKNTLKIVNNKNSRLLGLCRITESLEKKKTFWKSFLTAPW